MIPLSIGILCPPIPRIVKTVIKRNTPYPIQVVRVGKTNSDHQRSMMMPLYEGEHLTAERNNFLGMLTLVGLDDRKKGEVLVDISLIIDRKGELTATATDRKTKAAAHHNRTETKHPVWTNWNICGGYKEFEESTRNTSLERESDRIGTFTIPANIYVSG